MIFLQAIMLIGLLAIAIPIIIHLLNRSKPKPIEWGAMQFLTAAITARRRRVNIEDGILLCLRCLALASLALAMARPFLPSMAAIPWALILPGILIATLCASIATVLWTRQQLRRRLLVASGFLLAFAVLASLLERHIQARHWMTAGGGGDTVIILDASLSMTMTRDGQSCFARALEEAKTVIEKSRPGDAIAIILGGPVPHPLIHRPTSDRNELLQALKSPECRPTGGIMATLEALNLAASILADGPNVSKTVMVFTDGQSVGWDPQAEARWSFLASSFKMLPAPPLIICRRLPPPSTFRNAVVSAIHFDRSVIGTDRPVNVDVTVGNSGNSPIHPSSLEWIVDGQPVEQTPIIKDLIPQAAEVFRFNYRFTSPGYHVVQARILAEDDLPADNSLEQVVHVINRLPVLLVEGATTEHFFFRKTASLIRMALTPRNPPQDGGTLPKEMSFLVEPAIVEAQDINTVRDLSSFRVIILADVPRLPTSEAERLAAFVKAGGGLLITPGNRAEPAFYNAWQTPAGESLLPAMLEKRVTPADPLRLDLASFTHPALQLVAQPDQSDARLGLIASYWQLATPSPANQTRIGGRLDSGAPWFLERQLGKGRVFMTPTAFDRRDSNLSSLKCFVPLVHEMVYALAEPALIPCNIAPGSEWILKETLPLKFTPTAATASATVRLPSGLQRQVPIELLNNQFIIRIADTRQPGLVHVTLPDSLTLSAGVVSNQASGILFAINPQPEESHLTLLTDADIASIRKHVTLFLPGTIDELLNAITGKIPGQELWKILILCALLTLIAESALTRWITLHRHLHQTKSVVLKSPAESIQATKSRLAELMET